MEYFVFSHTVLISNFPFANDMFLLYLKIAIYWHIRALGSVTVHNSENSIKLLFSQLIL